MHDQKYKFPINPYQNDKKRTNWKTTIKETYSKYITPMKPHQKDPREVNNKPLLNCSFIDNLAN